MLMTTFSPISTRPSMVAELICGSSTTLPSDPKLVKLASEGKVVLLPHMSSATIEGRVDMGEKVVINIRTFFDGHRPPDRVLPGRL